jgi:hypothetical protein
VVAPMAVAPARATPRNTRRRHQKRVWPSACWFRYQETSVPGSMSRSRTKKSRAQAPPWVTCVNSALKGKVSPIRCFGSFYQISVILFVTKALIFSNYLDNWACETGIVVLG